MGSVDVDPDEFTVLVTGFDAFKAEYPQNPSWEIARGLPAYLPPRAKKAIAEAAAAAAPEGEELPPVRIVVYPEPVRVSYQVVRKLVPHLWDDVGQDARHRESESSGGPEDPFVFPPGFVLPRRVDLLLHIGMAGPRLHYALERVGRRDGYGMRDVDGVLLGDTPADRSDPRWVWYGVPPALESHLDLDDVLKRWRSYSPHVDLRISVDAGRYLCDFIYFSSLAHLYRQNKDAQGHDPRYSRRRVAFLHVPAAAAPERIAAGRELVVELIRSLADSELAARRTAGEDHGKPAAEEEAMEPAAAAAAVDASVPGADTATGKWYRD